MKKIVLIILCAVLMFTAFPKEAFAAAALKVNSVTFVETGNNTYKVSWKLSKTSEKLNVHVYLSVSDHDYEVPSTELGSIRSGSEGSLSVTIPDVDSGYYHFMIGVTTMGGTVTYAFSDEALFFDNPAGVPPLSGVTIGRSDDTVYAVWNDDTPAILYIYDAETKELLSSEHGYDKPLSAKIPSGHKDVLAGVAAYDGKGGRFTDVLCPAKGLPDVSAVFPEEAVFNQPEYVISAPSGAVSRIFLNGEECKPVNGEYVLDLEEGENDAIAFLTDSSGVTAAEEKTLILDTTPPELMIENPGSTMTTSKKNVFIQGYARDYSVISCDGEAVAMVGDCFSIEKSLALGENRFELTASDKAGNKTVATVEVRRSFLSDNLKTIIIIVVFAIAGLLAEAYLLLYRQRRKKKHD